MRGLQFGERIDKDERLAAFQDELIDRKQRLVRQVLRVHEHQHIDIGRDRIDVGGQRLDRIELLQLLHDRHRLGRTAAHHRHHVAFERQRADQPDHGLLRKRQAVDELGQIVFEKALALGLEERDDLLIVGRVGRGETEIDLLASDIERHSLQPERDGAVLGIRERQRVVDFEADLAVGRCDILIEQFAHALRIDAVGRDFVGEAVRIIEPQRDRLFDPGERPLRAARQRVKVLTGEVEPPRKKAAGDDVDRNQHQRDADERRDGDSAPRGEKAAKAIGNSHFSRFARHPRESWGSSGVKA